MATRIKLRRGTAAQWTAANPTLQLGEPGYETDTGKIKVGDGVTAWSSLAYSFRTADTLNSQAASYYLDRTNHTGTQAQSTIVNLVNDLASKEPAFSKNTAFNKNFGTATTDVPEIGATLGNSQVVETNASGKLITAAKGTAYNKDFGTAAGTVMQGNDSRVFTPESFSAFLTSNQTIATSTFTKVQLGTEEFDTANRFDNATNYRWTCVESGRYNFYCQGMITGVSALSTYWVFLYKNGSAVKRFSYVAANISGGQPTSGGSANLNLSAGDYIEMYIWQNTGSNMTLVGTSGQFTYLTGHRIG